MDENELNIDSSEDGDMNDVINNAMSLLPEASEILATLGTIYKYFP